MPSLRSRLIAAAVAALVLPGCSRKAERPAKVVNDLRFEGNERISSRTIKKRILTSKPGWWPFAKEQPFDPAAWEVDLDRIERLYESRGFYQAEVKGEVEERNEREVALWVRIREGEPTRIDAVEVRGLESLPAKEREEVLEELPLRAGDVLIEGRWAAAKDQIRTRLRNRGHAEAKVEGVGRIDVESHRATLTIDVTPGRRYQFGNVSVRNERSVVNSQWVADEVLVAMGRDRTFSDAKLREAERRIFNMGAFSTVRVTTGDPDAQAGVLPVIVEVTDAPFRTLRLGGGAGFDQVRNEARAFAEWNHRNWLGGLRRLRLRAQAGYAFIPNAFAVATNDNDEIPRSGPIFLTAAEFEQPRFLGAPTLSLRTLAEGERRLEQAYTSLTARGNVGVIWRPWVDFTLLPSYQMEGSWIDAPSQVTEATAPLVLGCDDNPCFQRLSFLEQVATLDLRDDPLAPKRGYFASVGLQEGGGPLGGDFDYLRVLAEGRGYVTPAAFDDELTFAFRVQVGSLFPRSGKAEDSPVLQRFYAGGGVSMRGYNNRRLSPLLGVPVGDEPYTPTTPITTLPIGGNGLLVGSAELRWALSQNLLVASFVDTGRVARERFELADVTKLTWAVGVGLRYLTPIGPIRVDLARRLPFGERPELIVPTGSRAYQDDTSCFGIGGSKDPYVQTDGSCVFHISIGEAF